MNYIGENLIPGQLGHFCVVLSFVASLLSTYAFFQSASKRNTPEETDWLRLGRFSFLLHGLTVFSIIGILFYILTGKMYEYNYAWANVSDDLPVQYVFSAFWKEQQGSFLLWSFWHVILSVVVILKGGKWEAPVLTVVSLTEAIIGSMLLGLYFGHFRLGASPFDLLRDTMNAPIFQQADYLSKISGQGLNPLLQNYWMTIHPPTLFLGFASTVFPFAFAASGLWYREHKTWLKPALGWSLFSAGILGLGILMGGAWAYEALSFAGYWAWDPVENASLVPWLTLVAGIHTNLVARSTGYSIRSTYGFYLLSFVLILYSTYLTRSGVLGDTSVHSFTEMGLGYQLILLVLLFAAIGLWLFVSRYKDVPDVMTTAKEGETQKKAEETIQSREFWMFLGSLVLLFSAVLITGATSLPVFNKIVQFFNPDYVGAALKDPVEHHNRYQLWIAVFIGFLTGIGIFTRYSERNWKERSKKFALHTGVAAVVAGVLTVLNRQWIEINAWQLYTLLFSAMFALAANLDYLISVARGNIKMASAAISHLGFGALILGVLSTGLGKAWISTNKFVMRDVIEGAGEEELNKNVILLKGSSLPIRDFNATYLKDTIERQTRTFAVRFDRRDKSGNPSGESFELYPNVMYDRQFSKIVANNPSTKHYWDYDIFTMITSLPKAELDPEFARQQEDSLKYVSYSLSPGDTLRTESNILVLQGVTKNPSHHDYVAQEGDLALGLQFKAFDTEDTTAHLAEPMMYIRPSEGGFTNPAQVNPLELKLRLNEKTLQAVFDAEDKMKYTAFELKEGDSFSYKGYQLVFSAVEKNVKHPSYSPKEGDIAVAASISIQSPDGKTGVAKPVYLIRDNTPFSLKDDNTETGLSFRFEDIDPAKGILTIGVADLPRNMSPIPFELAENVQRSDYVVLEAIIFPGINLVWAGSLLMLFGFALSLWRRWKEFA